jgi:two-component system NarL family response regulator
MSQPINVLLVDDHPMVRDGVMSCLAFYEDVNVVGTAKDGLEAIAMAEQLVPDVIMMDISMPALNGIDATEAIMDSAPAAKILIFSMHDNAEYITNAVQAGASGYILKNTDAEEVYEAIVKVASGERYFGASIAKILLTKPVQQDTVRLTTREQTVLSFLAQGLSSKQIAVQTNISIRTVDAHRRNIKAKLGLDTVADMIRYAVEHGLVRQETP